MEAGAKAMESLKKNFVYQIIYQVLCMILPLVTSPFLARTLGAEGIGIYSYVSVVNGYFVLTANLGMYKYGIREIAMVKNSEQQRSRVFWEIWSLHSAFALCVGAVYAVYILFFATYRKYFLFVAASYLGGVININWLFFGMEDFKKVAVRDIMIKLATFVLILCSVRTNADLGKYFIIMSGGSLVANLLYWVMYRGYVSKVKVSWKRVFAHWRGMISLFIPVLLESLYSSMDRVMLGTIRTEAEVGYYDNADKALIARTIIHSLTIVLMPRMANLLADGKEKDVERLMRKSTNITLCLVCAFAFGTSAVAKEFSVLFWGTDFLRCANLIIVMAMGMPGAVLSREIREQYLIAAEKDREYLWSAAAGVAVNLVINSILIPLYGAIGAAIATLISEYVVLAVQIVAVRKELPMLSYIHGNEWYIIFGAVMFLCVRSLGECLGIHVYSLFLEVILGVILYLVFCTVFWKVSSQNYYFELMQTFGKKFRRKLSRR